MKRLVLMMAVMVTGYSCGDLVIKVNKKSKDSNLSSAEADKSMSLADSKFFLDDMDDLRTAAVNTVVKYLEGEDFRKMLRSGFRDFHASLIREAMKSLEVRTMSLDTKDLVCDQGQLDLSGHQANQYLGILLKSALLGKMSEINTKALNADLASSADAITTLVLKEIGLNVDGTTTVENVDGKTVTKSKVVLSLVPFESDSIEVQNADKKRKIELSFDRAVGENQIGTFDGVILASHVGTQGTVEKYKMNISASRVSENGLYQHRTRVAFGKAGEVAKFVRQLTFRELEGNKVRVIDRITSNGKTEISAELVDLNKIKECVMEAVKVTDDDKKDDAEGESQSQDNEKQTVTEETKGSTDTETETNTDTETETEVIEDVDQGKVGNPNQSPNQSPVQSSDK